MNSIFTQIQQEFGVQEFPDAMFYEFEYALRFELGGGGVGIDRPMRRFIHAFERASAISQTLFEHSAEVFLLLSSYGETQPNKKRLKPLKLCGIKHSEVGYLGKTPQNDTDYIAAFGCDLFQHWDTVKLKDKQSIAEIMWLCIAPDCLTSALVGQN